MTDKELWEKSQVWDSSDDGRGKLKILESVEKFAELRAALAQPDPIYLASDGTFYPIPRQRKPLTDEEIASIYMNHTDRPLHAQWNFARAIEAAHGIKE